MPLPVARVQNATATMVTVSSPTPHSTATTKPDVNDTTAGEVLSAGATKTNHRSRKRSIATATTTTETTVGNTNSTDKSAAKPKSIRKPRKSSVKKSSLDDDTSAPSLEKSSKKTPLSSSSSSSPPKYVLVLDNGSDTVKYGWSIHPQPTTTIHNDTTTNIEPKHHHPTAIHCQHMPNITARLTQQWTILVGNDITTQVKNPNVSCTALTRSCTERGMMTNMGNQIQVWKHILDLLHIIITPTSTTETSIAFGWNKGTAHRTNPTRQDPTTATSPHTVLSHQCGVMIGVPPYTPRSILDHIMSIWYDEFRVSHVGFCVSTVAAAIHRPMGLPTSSLLPVVPPSMLDEGEVLEDASNVVPIACIVDLGYSAIHVIPVYDKKVISNSSNTPAGIHNGTIRRIPFGGKHMINLLKYYCSYRQWNLMDSEWIVRDVFEKTAFVSTSFMKDMKLAQKLPYFGKRPFDCEYILPNYDTTFIGQVQIPESVQLEIERLKQQRSEEFQPTNIDETNSDDEDEDDEDYNENDMNVDDVDDDNDDDIDDEDDENESPEQIRQRLLKQRDDERRLREIEAEQHQILNVSTERFAIPEALFRPSDVGLPTDWANVPQAIVQSIEACPPIYRPGLYQSIQLTGGLSQLPNLKERLLVELRAIVPCQYPLNITIADSPVDCAWNGIANITRQEPYDIWSVNREEWEASSKRGAWKRLHMNKGGHII